MKTRILQYWDGFNERERRAATVGLMGVVLYLMYSIYSPIKQSVLEHTRLLHEKRTTLSWMQHAKEQYVPAAKGPKTLDGSKGLSVFSDTLSKASFHESPYQLQQMPEGALQLAFESVPYSAFLHWLWEMGQRYAMTIKAFDAEKTDTQGLVRLNIIIEL